MLISLGKRAQKVKKPKKKKKKKLSRTFIGKEDFKIE